MKISTNCKKTILKKLIYSFLVGLFWRTKLVIRYDVF